MEERFLQAEPLFKAATVTCIPRLRAGGSRRPRRGASAGTVAATTPVSVLDRLRDAVLRLVMLSAAPKGALQQQATKTGSTSAAARMSPSPTTYPDSYRSEAVDECIRFLKRSSAGDGGAPAAATSPLRASADLHACAL